VVITQDTFKEFFTTMKRFFLCSFDPSFVFTSFFLAGILLFSLSAGAQISLPRLLSDHAILQRDRTLNLYGSSSPGERMNLEFKGSTYSTVANESGRWKIEVPPQRAGGPFDLTFTGKNKVVIRNVLFGDVWLCSGQSNMEMLVNNVKDVYPEIIASSNNSSIRHFTVPQKYDFKQPHQELSGGQWTAANPETVLKFSAVAYFFARALYEKEKVPVGLITAAVGGSAAESWMSEEALQEFPHLLNEGVKFRSDSLIQAIETSDRERINAWYVQLGKKDVGITSKWKNENVDDNDWATIRVPAYWDDDNHVKGNGVVWFRRSFTLGKLPKGPCMLLLGRMVDQDSVFVNGQFVGTTGYQYPQRRYIIKEGLLKEGANVISIKIINQTGRGGFVPDKPYCIIHDGDTTDLKGIWKYKQGASMPALAGQTFIRWKPIGLYNAMIAPLVDFPIRGALWYQGESNADRRAEYKELLPALIRDWRRKWKNQFPFLLVQLPNFMEAKADPSESNWAAFRQAQYEVTKVPKTAMAVTIDLGDWNDIHPLRKKEVGDRLALLARKFVYGEKNVEATGPIPASWKFYDDRVEITFNNCNDGLKVKQNGPVKHVAISSDGNKFVWAKTKIRNNVLIVWQHGNLNPVAVRYAWADNPDAANLENKEGLPAMPFEVRRD
jgi:sialate O-acetylesterase